MVRRALHVGEVDKSYTVLGEDRSVRALALFLAHWCRLATNVFVQLWRHSRGRKRVLHLFLDDNSSGMTIAKLMTGQIGEKDVGQKEVIVSYPDNAS